jgi:hypothetical protein
MHGGHDNQTKKWKGMLKSDEREYFYSSAGDCLQRVVVATIGFHDAV